MNENISRTPFVDSKACDGWSGDAVAIDPSEAGKLERLLNQIAEMAEKLHDSPISFLQNMTEFSKNWKENREEYLG